MPLCAGSKDQLHHHWKYSFLGVPGPPSEAVNFPPGQQGWQPRWGSSCTWLLSLSSRDCRELIPDSESASRATDYSPRVAEQVVCWQAEGQVLYPLRGWNPENDFFLLLFFSCSNSAGFSEIPWLVQNWEIQRSFASLMVCPVQNTAKGLVLSQGSNSRVQAGSSTCGRGLCWLSYLSHLLYSKPCTACK